MRQDLRGARRHAKSHGVLVGRLGVVSSSAPELAQGLFAQPRSYATVMRFSTNPGDMLADNVSTPRGLALKVNADDSRLLQKGDGVWDVRVQLALASDDFPIEKANQEWPQEKSAYRVVGKLTVEAQDT